MIHGFTQYPNYILDKRMREISDAGFKVYSVVVRQTKGWQKETDIISLTQFEEKTGKSRMTVIRALRELVDEEMIEVCGKTRNGKAYRIKQIDDVELVDTCKNYSHNNDCLIGVPVEGMDPSSKNYVTPKIKLLDTQKDTQYKIENNKKNICIDDLNIPQNIDRDLLSSFIAMRLESRKPLNYTSLNLILKKLVSFGDSANEALTRALIGGYMDIVNPNMTRDYGKHVNSSKTYSPMKSRRF